MKINVQKSHFSNSTWTISISTFISILNVFGHKNCHFRPKFRFLTVILRGGIKNLPEEILKRMKNQTSMETMQRLASQMDGLSIASRGLRAIRPAKKIVALPKRVQKENKKGSKVSDETKSSITISNYKSVTDSAICSENYVTENNSYEEEKELFHEKFSKNDPKYLDLLSQEDNNSLDQSETESELSSNENYELKNVTKKVTFDQSTNQRRGPAENTSGYGSETSAGTGSSDSSGLLANQSKSGIQTEFNDESGSSGVENGAHCVRCHKECFKN